MSPGYPFNIRSKGERLRLQGQKVQKKSGNRVAGVFTLYLCGQRLVDKIKYYLLLLPMIGYAALVKLLICYYFFTCFSTIYGE